jgi:hypothetical protein
MAKVWGSGRGLTASTQNIYEESETQNYRLGTRLPLGDRVFHYASAGAALDQGYLLESAALGGATTTAQIDLTIATAAVAGDSTLTVTSKTTAQAANLFAEGYVSIVSGTNAQGSGVAYRIKSHPAIGAAGNVVLTLYDEIAKAITVDCKASLCANLWRAVKQTAVTTAVGMPVGVPLIDVTSAYYFWCQTWGPCSVLTGSTVVVDSAIIRGLEAGESDIQGTNGITPEIGYSIEAGADGDLPLTYLRIAP